MPQHPRLFDRTVQPGTHNRNTARGRFDTEAGDVEPRNPRDSLGRAPRGDVVQWEFIRPPRGEDAPMDRPAQTAENRRWRSPV